MGVKKELNNSYRGFKFWYQHVNSIFKKLCIKYDVLKLNSCSYSNYMLSCFLFIYSCY